VAIRARTLWRLSAIVVIIAQAYQTIEGKRGYHPAARLQCEEQGI
jgi:hypothetical protein